MSHANTPIPRYWPRKLKLSKPATEIDFKPYLDVINADSQRTRAAIYVLIAAMLLIFTAYRNTTYPDWLDARLARLQQAAACLDHNFDDDVCRTAKQYANNFLFQDALDKQHVDFGGTEESRRELREQINVFMRQRTEALTLRLPFFGIALDMNDLGMVCGLLLTAILYVLFASLKSEIDDLEVAHRKAVRSANQRDNLEQLVMAQVLAPPSKRGVGVGQGLYVVFLLVPVLQIFVFRDDCRTYNAAAILQGTEWATIETWVDGVALGLVIILSVLCVSQQWLLNRRLKKIRNHVDRAA